MRAAVTVAGLLALSTMLGVIRLATDPDPIEATAAALVALGALVMTLVSISGLLVGRSRWARVTGLGLAALWLGLVAAAPLDPLGVALVTSAAAAAAGHAGPWARHWARRLPRPDGPPIAAVVAMLTLLATPIVIGLAQADGLGASGWGLAGWSVAMAWALARAWQTGLWGTRVVHPLAGVAVGGLAGMPGGLVIAAWTIGASVAAWHPSVADAFRAPAPTGTVSIPPELAPDDVLDAAGADETGRRRRS